MHRLSTRLIIAVLTFLIGVAAATLWFFYKHRVVEKDKVTQPSCSFMSIDNANAKGVSYFPSNAFAADQILGQRKAEGYSSALLKMEEPTLLTLPNCVHESYRFMWLRAFDYPIVVRVWKSTEGKFLVAKQMDDKGQIARTNFRALNEDEWLTFSNLFNQISFWDLPTVGGTLDGNDGAEWILEASRNNQYHIVDRWMPKDTNYRSACAYLLKISGLDIDPPQFNGY